jgi:hypothetical protein
MAQHQLEVHILPLEDGVKFSETSPSQGQLLDHPRQIVLTKLVHAPDSAGDPTPISPAKSHRRTLAHQPIHNPLIPRLQYLTEIPPSPPVMLHLVDEAGAPVVHPLQIDPDSLTPAEAGDYAESPPTSSSSRSAVSDRDYLCLEAGQYAPVESPLCRPPLAFLRRHGSEASPASSSGTSNSSSSCSSPSPLAGTPITRPEISMKRNASISPVDDESVALRVAPAVNQSPMAGIYGQQEEARAMRDCAKMS